MLRKSDFLRHVIILTPQRNPTLLWFPKRKPCEVGFHYGLGVYDAMLDFRGIWNTYICLLNTVLPNLREHGNPKLTPMVKNKSTQRVGAFKCLFTLESGFQRTPSCRKFILRFNSGLRIGLIRIEFDIRCRENFVDVCTVFAMRDV